MTGFPFAALLSRGGEYRGRGGRRELCAPYGARRWCWPRTGKDGQALCWVQHDEDGRYGHRTFRESFDYRESSRPYVGVSERWSKTGIRVAEFAARAARSSARSRITPVASQTEADHPRWVAAVCPNCHRRVHHGQDGTEYNNELADYLGSIEPS